MQIKCNNVKYLYNPKDITDKNALNGVSLTIKQGEFVAIVGKTGSGKSTLVQTFNGLLEPTDGYTQVGDFIVTGNKKLKKSLLKTKSKEFIKLNKKQSKLKKVVGLVFQFPEYQLFNETILKDVMFGPKNFGLTNEEAEKISRKTLKEVGIPEDYFDKSPFELSGGEKRRVGIAGIIASQPDILVLDEPTAGLDTNGKKEILDMIEQYHKEGHTIIVVTHDMDLVMERASKVFVLNDGVVIHETTPDKLFNENDLSLYSLEQPAFYKFKKELKEQGFAGDIANIKDVDSLINLIVKSKIHGVKHE
ncbi:MAG: energy-coupling factor transporter ATPase [Erysipelotrichaceae bacterium]|jgi:energy-coupling factor transport system ATP-binding protein|nr:energy-coupling factor transporter ATPase [Erysipelotrichaceae bacterium]MCB9500097.1 energy-coupling factor transporter ATPase [Erysipelotrichaceae bacterium]